MYTNINQKDISALADYLQYVPYDVSRKDLYTPQELYANYDFRRPETFEEAYDTIVYSHFMKTGKQTFSAKEALSRCMHDHSISHALAQFLTDYPQNSVVGIMGGHGLSRNDSMFHDIVRISKRLTEEGFLMTSGGGPGAMEATHLGAWMAGYSDADVNFVLHRLSAAPSFHDEGWLETAFSVINDFPQTRYRSLGIPTWLYGHEPATPFASHIAKYFDNSIREDNLLTFSVGGIIYSPGSAGTMQEIFQDATHNHYLSFGTSSPMIFLDKKYWSETMPVFPLLQDLMKRGRYSNLILSITDDPESVVSQLIEFRRKN